ncbi:unnamed protein product [Miscanthus lutarioriparius]|uniref:Uncharacterized protein n=1 Tax=Miscanthus lutarioriparius TaxID=422564 RepID=A0A811N741_9POAL|nr:unnamed protein product [Miscanthus lutarioriparius]
MTRETRPPAASSPAPGYGTPPLCRGVPSVVAVACLGVARCVLTDVAALLSGLRANAGANGMSVVRADVRELRWGDRLQLKDDVFYDPEDMSAMAATLRGMWWTDEDEDEDGGGGSTG